VAAAFVNKPRSPNIDRLRSVPAKASTTLDLYSQAIDESKLAAQWEIAMAITGGQPQAD
jgi:hypothetical protein